MSKAIQQNKEQFWREHIQRQEQLGLSAPAYCRREGLVTAQMGYWRKKLYGASKSKSRLESSGFSEVQIVENPCSTGGYSKRYPDPQWVAEFLVHLWRQR